MGQLQSGGARRCAAFGGALAALLLAQPVLAAATAAPAKAITLRPLSIVNTEDLDFGTMIPAPTAGTVIIDPFTSARTKTGGPVLAGGSPRAGQFVTYGGPLQTLQVNRGPLPVLTRAGGGASMNVTQLTLDGPTTRFLNAAGVVTLNVGGTLAINANQLEGDYSGAYQIIVTYF